MGCLKLTYRSEMPTLKVAWNSLNINRKGCAGAYRFGYQGSEKDDEITGSSGTHYTTYFRELDTRIVRWWSLDPKTNQLPWESPYLSMGGNPIWFNDPLGDKWADKDSKQEAKSAKVDIRNRIKELREEKSLGTAPNDVDDQIRTLKLARRNISEMGRDKEYVFHLNPNYKSDGGGTYSEGNDVYVNYKLVINRTIPGIGIVPMFDRGIRLHEIKHGHQIMKGELTGNRLFDPLYDRFDELEAYRMQYSLLGRLDLTTDLSRTRFNITITNYNDITTSLIGRVSEGGLFLYKNIPTERKNNFTHFLEMLKEEERAEQIKTWGK